ncbi:sensor histidine kinase [Spirosoma migulaei]
MRLRTVLIRRPSFFSKYEWWYHLLMMPILFPLGNYYFIGPSYFTDPIKFGVGTVVVFGLYWLSIVTLTLTVWWAIRRYPDASQTLLRTVVMLTAVGSLTVGLAIFDVWVYSLLPATGVQFSWAAVRPIWVLGLIFDVFLCMALGLFYAYARWKQDMTESEQLERASLQNQYDALKGQLNPHFLFNALNSLSILIGEEPKLAEQFVDKLAIVYRYMLQPDRRGDAVLGKSSGDVTTLQAELDFIRSYTDLLTMRYGKSLDITLPAIAGSSLATYVLPTLSLLTLVDNAIKYNSMSGAKPLVLSIEIMPDGWVVVTNNQQPKAIRLETDGAGLGSLTAKYRLLSEKSIMVDTTDAYFRVTLPLLPPNAL